ncbi:MAG: hypothetical protein FJ045_01300, partial [Crenarchaeota archaeon]|nr:hypothetical protein [Thermoproteota archaeon]
MNLKERTKQAVISYWMRYRQTVHMVIQQYLPRECKDGDPEDAGRVRVLQKQELDNGGASTTKGSNIHKIEIALERRQTSVDAQASRLIAAAQESACVSNSVMAQATLEVFLKVADVKRIVNEALSSIKADEFTPIYTVSSWFLHDCFNYLV